MQRDEGGELIAVRWYVNGPRSFSCQVAVRYGYRRGEHFTGSEATITHTQSWPKHRKWGADKAPPWAALLATVGKALERARELDRARWALQWAFEE